MEQKPQTTNRVVIVSSLVESKQLEIGHFQKFFKHFQTDATVVTGMLLIYSNCVIHCLEGSQVVMKAFMKEMTTNPIFGYTKVLAFSDDVQRFFPFWASRIIESRSSTNLEIPSENDIKLANCIADPVFMMISIGHHIAHKDVDLKTALDELTTNYKNLIPKQDLLLALSACEDIMSGDEWVSLYSNHHNLVLGGGFIHANVRAGLACNKSNRLVQIFKNF